MRKMFTILFVIAAQWVASASFAGRVEAQMESRVEAVQRGLDVTLMLFSTQSDGRFLGSAFIYGSDGIALTNAHVIGGAPYVIVQYRDGHREHVRVFAQDAGRDIAILNIGGTQEGLRASQTPLQIGSSVIALGAPLGLGYTATRGIVAADPRQVDLTVPLRLVQHDAAINPGNSGGPLIDETGALVGMNSQIADGSRYFIGISYAISADDLLRLVPQLRAGTLPRLPELGFDARAVTDEIAKALRIDAAGLLIDNISKDSAADLAGIRPGDVVISLNGAKVGHVGTLAFLLETAMGQPAKVEVWRQDRRITLDLDLLPAMPAVWQEVSAMPARVVMLGDIGVTLDGEGLVGTIAPSSRAARDGVRPGDLILGVNGWQGRSEQLMGVPLGETAVVLIARDDGRRQHIVLHPWSSRQVLRPLGGNVLDMTVERY